jgi:serine phosphatase RsbU (regulator of sigma subunit)
MKFSLMLLGVTGGKTEVCPQLQFDSHQVGGLISRAQIEERILEKVSTFSGREQEDDITLVVARGRFGGSVTRE